MASTLRHAIQHAEEATQRVSGELAKLAMEESEVRGERERLEDDRAATADGLRRAKEAAEASLHAKTARETELATARIELEWKSNNLRVRERELAGLTARLASLTDLEAARAGYTEAARMVLAQANGHFVARGQDPVVLEGAWTPSRLSLARFADLDTAKAWYRSDDYQAAKAIREGAARLSVVAFAAES